MASTRTTTSTLLAITVLAIALAGCGRISDRQTDEASPDSIDPTTEPGVSDDGAAPTTVAPTTVAPTDPTDPAGATTAETAVSPPVPATGETVELEITTPDGRDRSAHLYIPDSLPDTPVPLLVALHGGGGSGTQFQQNSGYDEVAEANDFLVVYPDGIGSGLVDDLRTWNGGVCCGAAAREDVDDVAFLRQLVEHLEGGYEINPGRVFATGHSNGMIMSYRLVCEAADVFVAAAGQAGTLGVEPCSPAEPVSVLHIHGEADLNLPMDGGRGVGPSGVDFPSPLTSIRTVAAADNCDPEPDLAASNPLTIQRWTRCDGGTEVVFVSVAGASHAWMGADSPSWLGASEPFRDYDSSLESWTFLAAHPRQS